MAAWLSKLFGKNPSEKETWDDGPIQPKEPIPFFKYHPHPMDTLAFEQERSIICHSCNRPTQVYYEYPFDSPMISDEDDFYFCAYCIKNGDAAKKFQGRFQDPEFCEEVSDPEKLDELCHRTPGYYAPEQTYWLAHCDDFCALIDTIDDWSEIEERGIEREIAMDWLINDDDDTTDLSTIKKHLHYQNGGAFQGYLFRCLHCGKHRLYVDCDSE